MSEYDQRENKSERLLLRDECFVGVPKEVCRWKRARKKGKRVSEEEHIKGRERILRKQRRC